MQSLTHIGIVAYQPSYMVHLARLANQSFYCPYRLHRLPSNVAFHPEFRILHWIETFAYTYRIEWNCSETTIKSWIRNTIHFFNTSYLIPSDRFYSFFNFESTDRTILLKTSKTTENDKQKFTVSTVHNGKWFDSDNVSSFIQFKIIWREYQRIPNIQHSTSDRVFV